jgi:hypothetical protein
MAVAVAPLFVQGEIAEKPNPTPKISRISDNAAAAVAPAKIESQDTPDEVVSGDTSNKFRSVVVIIISICETTE